MSNNIKSNERVSKRERASLPLWTTVTLNPSSERSSAKSSVSSKSSSTSKISGITLPLPVFIVYPSNLACNLQLLPKLSNYSRDFISFQKASNSFNE